MQEAPLGPEQLFTLVKEEVLAGRKTPLATYRLQFHAGFGFEQARSILPYLERLGISDLYASPYLKAAPGSTHGYDVVDHHALNPEVGSPEQHQAFCNELQSLGLGQVLDFVPNHMGIEQGNEMWDDVLENGPSSLYAPTFDIDWDPVKEELKNKVLLPVLGDQFGDVLERGELKLLFQGGAFFISYYQRLLPVPPRCYATVLGLRVDELEKEMAEEREHFDELQSILTALEHLPQRTETDPARRAERNREKEIVKRRLFALTSQSPSVQSFIERNVALFNGTPGDPRSFDRLDELLSQCCFRLAHWRVAGEEINYRRFFDINSLAAIRVETTEVFEQAHQLIFRWLAEKKVTGLRIDHPDGLFDPTAYFQNLQEWNFTTLAKHRFLEAGGSIDEWPQLEPRLRSLFGAEIAEQPDSPLRKSLYVVVEKIQGGKERIPEAWAIDGTTGYRFANNLGGLFVDSSNEAAISFIYRRFIGRAIDFHQLLYEKKKLIMSISMASEINMLARELNRISEMNRHSRDFTLNALRRALVEFIALFPVYRTYVDGLRPEVDLRDTRYIQWTIARAKERDLVTNVSLFDFLADILLRRYPEHLNSQEREVMLRFAMKVQQVTGPVMAKGLEDTVFYLYNRLLSLNEVGGEPDRFGTSEHTFHLRNQERAESRPGSLLTTSTHDTKRSEDVRARLNVLSEIPGEWASHLRRWARWNKRWKIRIGPSLWPSANDEYLFYQSVLGAWPMGAPISETELARFRQRIQQYMLKAIREAKVYTSWVNPDSEYEGATARFVERALDRARSPRFMEDIEDFKRRIEAPGQVNGLAQVLLKIASPGTTDIYQGCELWELSLVDPDNRRPVDFSIRERLLADLDRAAEGDCEALCRELMAEMSDGRIKLYVLSQGLRFRRRQEELFRSGEYIPLSTSGPAGAQAICFTRRHRAQALVAIAPRLVTRAWKVEGLGEAFRDCYLPLPPELADSRFRDIYTRRWVQPRPRNGSAALRLGELLSVLPVSLLEKVNDD